MTSVLGALDRLLLSELTKYVEDQPRDARGRWTSHGVHGVMVGDRDALQRHLVDYKSDEGRDLTGPGTSDIADVAGGAGTTRYVDVSGLDELHERMGYTSADPVSTSTDMDAYVARRNATFRAQPIEQVAVSGITWTQPRVNDEKVAALQRKMEAPDWDWDKAAVFVLEKDGKSYLLNGHHRVVAAAASGNHVYPAHVLHV